jgi:hypothetical protein
MIEKLARRQSAENNLKKSRNRFPKRVVYTYRIREEHDQVLDRDGNNSNFSGWNLVRVAGYLGGTCHSTLS